MAEVEASDQSQFDQPMPVAFDEAEKDLEELCASAHLTDAVEVMRSRWMD